MYRQFNIHNSTTAHTVYLCVLCGSEYKKRLLLLLFNPLQHGGHYMYHQFYIQKFCVRPTKIIYGFVWISEQTSIISLQNILWLIFITKI